VFVLSGVGTLGTNHSEYIDTVLSKYKSIPFKVCMWHKNQQSYQTGDKEDETGYEVYGMFLIIFIQNLKNYGIIEHFPSIRYLSPPRSNSNDRPRTLIRANIPYE
jgi:hypothetical protein